MNRIIEPISLRKKITWVTLFSIAMGYLETAVVVYIRKHYYPNGFEFPLVPIGKDIAITELFREIATMIMLAGIGILCGDNRKERFAYFVYSFAVWDIFYYIFLYVLLGWPQSFMTFDVLFLIPVPWISPVLCPVLVSSLMILYFLVVIFGEPQLVIKGMRKRERIIMIIGCTIVLYSFMADYIQFVRQYHPDNTALTFARHKDLFSEAAGFIPSFFRWEIFIPGFTLMCGSVGLFFLRTKRKGEYEPDEWRQVG